MDFRQLAQSGSNPRPHAQQPAAAPSSAPHSNHNGSRKDSGLSDLTVHPWWRVLNVVMLAGIAILVAAIAFGFTRGTTSPVDNEHTLIDTGKYQAVFLNNSQVYFGHIQALNSNYVKLTDIYYLTQGTTTGSNGQPTNNGSYNLVKLGCQQIHDPADEMVINRSQVTFWENLQDKGQVVTKIKEFQKSNPQGPDCSQVSTQTQASGSNTQGSNAQTQPSSTPNGSGANGGASTNKQ